MRAGSSVRQISAEEILVEVGEERFIAAAVCPHRRGRLAFGLINQRTMRITCPLHHSTFDLRTGAQVAGPRCSSLRVREAGPATISETPT